MSEEWDNGTRANKRRFNDLWVVWELHEDRIKALAGNPPATDLVAAIDRLTEAVREGALLQVMAQFAGPDENGTVDGVAYYAQDAIEARGALRRTLKEEGDG